VKPDRTFFEHALARLNLAPDETVFFDDNQINVDGARSCGIPAFRVVGIKQTRSKLIELSLLSA
jgi:glucose-1-phosphatase